jgi:hypothetical protein
MEVVSRVHSLLNHGLKDIIVCLGHFNNEDVGICNIKVIELNLLLLVVDVEDCCIDFDMREVTIFLI